jgi:flavin reductase (DIM6/NTAB) family NADH-FMN oxidoreductase RutF
MSANVLALFRQLTLGVYIVGVAHGSQRDAFTASAVMQASYDPLLLTVAVNPQHASYALLRDGGTFAVSVLGREQLQLARRFGTASAEGFDKMRSVEWRSGHAGAPILAAALGYFDCVVLTDAAAGDHRLVVGQVVDGAVLVSHGVPLPYAETHNLDGSAALYPRSFAPRSR